MTCQILVGDCRGRMAELPDASVDSVVCDPPYHLTSIVKRFGAAPKSHLDVAAHKDQSKIKAHQYGRLSKGFMGQTWDGGDVAFDPATWAEVLRVLKPGGHLIAFSGTRTYHRMAVAIEDAGFEIRDQLAWIFGAGFPKSHNIDKVLDDGDRCLCRAETLPERDLRLVRDSDVSAPVNATAQQGQTLLAGLPEQGPPSARRAQLSAAEVRPEQSSVEGRRLPEADARQLSGREVSESAGMGEADGESGRLHDAAPPSDGANVRLPADANGSGEPQGSQSGEQSPIELGTVADERGSQARGAWPLCGGCGKPNIPTGYGSALKPAYEPIVLARKPLQGTILGNFLEHGTGALNIDGCRIEGGKPQVTRSASAFQANHDGRLSGDPHEGRWPANLCHDGSEEVLAGFPETTTNAGKGVATKKANVFGKYESMYREHEQDSGSAARFFYCAKATTDERGEGNTHPTVKPVALMRWLVRLVTPKGGTVLDPFMGSGSTLLACEAEQFNGIGCEMSEEYAAIAEARLRAAGGMFADVTVSRLPDEPTEAAA